MMFWVGLCEMPVEPVRQAHHSTQLGKWQTWQLVPIVVG